MDGIELVSVAHKLQPNLEMVIFSGYGEFEYAKKAMASGVSNYVSSRWILLSSKTR